MLPIYLRKPTSKVNCQRQRRQIERRLRLAGRAEHRIEARFDLRNRSGPAQGLDRARRGAQDGSMSAAEPTSKELTDQLAETRSRFAQLQAARPDDADLPAMRQKLREIETMLDRMRALEQWCAALKDLRTTYDGATPPH
jgi:hypothetical protein